jgi:membrane protein involved in colicin uptake
MNKKTKDMDKKIRNLLIVAVIVFILVVLILGLAIKNNLDESAEAVRKYAGAIGAIIF